MRCADCHGTGQYPEDTQCPLCGGRGHDDSGIGWPTECEEDPISESEF